MEPLEFMERLAALVPRPGLHLIRFHGVLAPNAKMRSKIVSAPPERTPETSSEDAHAQGAPGAQELGPAAQTGLRRRRGTLPELRRRLEDHRRPFDTSQNSHRRSAGDCQNPPASGPTDPRRAFLDRFPTAPPATTVAFSSSTNGN
jgi:hypothetical protein